MADYLPLVQQLRQRHQQAIEQVLVVRLCSPLSTTDELAAALSQVGKGYSVKAVGSQEFSFTSKYDGTRFSSTGLRPGNRPFQEQYLEARQRGQQLNRPAQESSGIEM